MGTESGSLDTMGRIRSGRFLDTMGTRSGSLAITMGTRSGRFLNTMGTKSGRYLGTMSTVVNRLCHFFADVSLIITLRISFSAWVVAESGREGKTMPVIATRGNGLRFFKFLYEWIVPNICLHKSYHEDSFCKKS